MIAIIDLDSTLIDTIYGIYAKKVEENEYTKQIPKLGSVELPEYVVLRPNVEKLLSYCKKNYEKVILCTFSKWNRGSIILDIFNIRDYFDEVIGYEKLVSEKGQNLYGNFIIVDDAPWNSMYTLKKLNFFGIDLDSESKNKINVSNIVIDVLPYNQESDRNRSDEELIMAVERMKKIKTIADKRKQRAFNKIKPLIKKIIEDDIFIGQESNLFIDLGFEEFMLADLFYSIEDELNISIPDELVNQINIVDDILAFIDSQ